MTSLKIFENLAKRLECRARAISNTQTLNDEERIQRRCMTVIYAELSNMIQAELNDSNKNLNLRY